jgi:alcohol dehydrogenase (cytochrome c)
VISRLGSTSGALKKAVIAKSEGRRLNALSIAACGAMALAASASTARAAEVTYERLVNPEPQNWLMNHHDFGSQRYSALDVINKSNVKNLRLAFAVALGGTSGNENLTATPLVDDGFMYTLLTS